MLKLILSIISLIYAFIVAVVTLPIVVFSLFRAVSISNKMDEAEERAPEFFRNLKSADGSQAVPGIEILSDTMIKLRYRQVRDDLERASEKRKERLVKATVNALVRDRLIDDVNGVFDEKHKQMLEQYALHGLKAVFMKGKNYQ